MSFIPNPVQTGLKPVCTIKTKTSPLPLHNCNLLRREAVEFVYHLINLPFKGACLRAVTHRQRSVGVAFPSIKRGLRGVLLLGGEGLVNEGDEGLEFFIILLTFLSAHLQG